MAVEVLMPALSPTMTEGKLSKWSKSVGDAVKAVLAAGLLPAAWRLVARLRD